MTTITIPAESVTILLNGHAFTDTAEGDVITITQPNAVTSRTNSRTGVTIAKRSDAEVTDLVIRVQKYSADDALLNSWKHSVNPTVINGSVKESFSRSGDDFIENWSLEAGSITDQGDHNKNSQDVDGLIEYTMQFRKGSRIL